MPYLELVQQLKSGDLRHGLVGRHHINCPSSDNL
jgi:hypothetical protein